MDITTNYSATETRQRTVTGTEKAFQILRWTFGLVPIVAGADKFMHLLTNWDQYLAPQVASLLPFSTSTFMSIVGIIEIVAGILVLVKPRTGALVVALWLTGIALNLLLTGQFFDVAVRDLVMAIAAWCLFLLSSHQKQ